MIEDAGYLLNGKEATRDDNMKGSKCMNAKKILCATLAVLMLLAMFAGCSKNDPDSAATATPTVAPPSETETVSEPDSEWYDLPLVEEAYTFTWWIDFNPAMQAYMNGVEDNIVYQWVSEQLNVHPEFINVSPSVAKDDFQIRMATNEYPNVMARAANYYTGGGDLAISDGVLINLWPHIQEYSIYLKGLMESDEEIYEGMFTADGNIVGFKVINETPTTVTSGVMVRYDWAEAVGYSELPSTYDELYNMLTLFKTELGLDSPMALQGNGTYYNNFYIGGFDVYGHLTNDPSAYYPIYLVDGVVKFGQVEDGFYEYLKMMSKWYSEGLIYSDFYSYSSLKPEEDWLTNEQMGVWCGDSTNLDYYQNLLSEVNSKAVVSGMEDPKLFEGQVIHTRSPSRKVAAAPGYGVTTAEGNIELITKFFDYLYGGEGRFASLYGIEGISYNLVDGEPVYTDLVLKNENGLSLRDNLYHYAIQDAFYDNPERLEQGYSDALLEAFDIWETNKDDDYYFNDNLYTLTAEEGELFNKSIGEIITYSATTVLQFIIGEVDLNDESWNDFKKTMFDLGLQECIDVKQAAYDRIRG